MPSLESQSPAQDIGRWKVWLSRGGLFLLGFLALLLPVITVCGLIWIVNPFAVVLVIVFPGWVLILLMLCSLLLFWGAVSARTRGRHKLAFSLFGAILATGVLAIVPIWTMADMAGVPAGGAKDLPEFTRRPAEEVEVGREVDAEPGQIAVLLPDGKRVTFGRRLTNDGILDESVKTLTVTGTDGKTKSLDFGQGHSGYNSVEIRCSQDFSRVWVLDVEGKHMYSGAAIDFKKGLTFPEGMDKWSVPWARPDTGKLVLRKDF